MLTKEQKNNNLKLCDLLNNMSNKCKPSKGVFYKYTGNRLKGVCFSTVALASRLNIDILNLPQNQVVSIAFSCEAIKNVKYYGWPDWNGPIINNMSLVEHNDRGSSFALQSSLLRKWVNEQC